MCTVNLATVSGDGGDPRRVLSGAGLVMFLAFLATPASASPKVQTFPVEVVVPTLKIDPAPDYPPIHEIGGVRVEVIPVPAQTRKMHVTTLEDRTGAADFLSSTLKSVWIWKTPLFELDPSHVQFQVRVTNKLPKVLRLEGVAIQFAVNGKTVPTDYAKNDLGGKTLLPNQTWEGIFIGPPVELLEQSGVLLAGLYDVITGVDDANTPLKRSNFEWIYAYQLSTTTQSDVKTRTKSSVTLEQAKALQGSRERAD